VVQALLCQKKPAVQADLAVAPVVKAVALAQTATHQLTPLHQK